MFGARTQILILTAALSWGLTGCGCNEPVDEEPTPTPAPTPEPQYNRGYYLDMDADSQGRIWLAYQDRETTSLNVARGTGSPIEFEHFQVEGQGEVIGGLLTGNFDGGNYNSIAVDSSDRPHVVHWDRDADRLRYAVRTGDGWDTTNAATSGGQFAALGLIGGTDPIVSFYDGELVVAWKADGSWDDETVDAGEPGPEEIPADVGQFTDLLVASDGTVWIAYYDVANGDLKVASGGPGAWTVQVWASEGNVGTWPTLSEHGGDIYVLFQDVDNKDLVLGRWTGATLETEIVDEGDFVGADSSIAWIGDTAVVMYHDGVNNDALLAVDDGSGWVLSTHMADGAVGFFNTILASESGQLTWSCFDHTTTDIVFQRFSL